jgi:transcription-repair coupling factor (superfamily II helicase)
LELRGAGNLLGPEQSGHIAAVGYELYCRLLEGAVEDLREGRPLDASPVVIDIGWTGYLPEAWIPTEGRRLDAYRRLCRAASLDAISEVIDDLESAYGPVPTPVLRLRQCREVAAMLMPLGVRTMVRRDADLVFMSPRPRPLLAALRTLPGRVRAVGQPAADGTGEVWWRPPVSRMNLEQIYKDLSRVLAAGHACGPMNATLPPHG